jgi:methyltransferase (TIGR00027 family)
MRAGRPSVTARWVAAQRARLAGTRPSTPGGDVAGEQRLYRDVRGGLPALPVGRPGGMAERTRFVDDEVTRAIGRGIDQVVLVGAGYDGRPLRFGGGVTRWFEVDAPATQADKRRRLAALGAEPAAVAYVGLDLLTGDLAAALDAAGHDPARPSLFVCEGLFASLTLEATASLCRTLRDRAPEGSVLAATFLVVPETGAGGKALRAAADELLRALGEPRRSDFLEGDAEKLFVVTGWRASRVHAARPGRIGTGSRMLVLAGEPAV